MPKGAKRGSGQVRPLAGPTLPTVYTIPAAYKEAVAAAAQVLGISASELIRVIVEESPYTREFIPVKEHDAIEVRR